MRINIHIIVLVSIGLFFLLAEDTLAAPLKDKEENHFSRIISLYSAHTENLVSLGAAEQLVGISQSDTYPQSILHKPRFSYREDPERFIAARPDLILVRPMIERAYPQLIEKLQSAGITVVSLQPNSVEEIHAYWRELGRLTGHEEQAEEMIETFTSQLQETATSLAGIPHAERPHVYFESMHAKMKTFATRSIAIFVLEQAGGVNIATDAKQVRTTNIAAYSKERILAHAQEIDVYLAQQGRMNPVTREMIIKEPGFKAIKAVQEGRVYLIEEQLVSRPTLRIGQGVKKLNSLLYPGRVAEYTTEVNHGKQ